MGAAASDSTASRPWGLDGFTGRCSRMPDAYSTKVSGLTLDVSLWRYGYMRCGWTAVHTGPDDILRAPIRRCRESA